MRALPAAMDEAALVVLAIVEAALAEVVRVEALRQTTRVEDPVLPPVHAPSVPVMTIFSPIKHVWSV